MFSRRNHGDCEAWGSVGSGRDVRLANPGGRLAHGVRERGEMACSPGRHKERLEGGVSCVSLSMDNTQRMPARIALRNERPDAFCRWTRPALVLCGSPTRDATLRARRHLPGADRVGRTLKYTHGCSGVCPASTRLAHAMSLLSGRRQWPMTTLPDTAACPCHALWGLLLSPYVDTILLASAVACSLGLGLTRRRPCGASRPPRASRAADPTRSPSRPNVSPCPGNARPHPHRPALLPSETAHTSGPRASTLPRRRAAGPGAATG